MQPTDEFCYIPATKWWFLRYFPATDWWFYDNFPRLINKFWDFFPSPDWRNSRFFLPMTDWLMNFVIFFKQPIDKFPDFLHNLLANFTNFCSRLTKFTSFFSNLLTNFMILFHGRLINFTKFSCDRLPNFAGFLPTDQQTLQYFFLRPIDEFHDFLYHDWTLNLMIFFPSTDWWNSRFFSSYDWWCIFLNFSAINQKRKRIKRTVRRANGRCALPYWPIVSAKQKWD